MKKGYYDLWNPGEGPWDDPAEECSDFALLHPDQLTEKYKEATDAITAAEAEKKAAQAEHGQGKLVAIAAQKAAYWKLYANCLAKVLKKESA